MLHLIMSPPAMTDIASITLTLDKADEILLLQDGVYGAVTQSHEFISIIEMLPSRVYLLEDDVLARGLTPYLHPNVRVIDYQQFVDLTVKHTKQITW